MKKQYKKLSITLLCMAVVANIQAEKPTRSDSQPKTSMNRSKTKRNHHMGSKKKEPAEKIRHHRAGRRNDLVERGLVGIMPVDMPVQK